LIEIDRGREELPDLPCYISIVTLYEFIRGKSDPIKAKALVKEIFGIIPLDNEVIEKASILWRELRGKGETVDERDLLIGATSISRKLPLWTKNEKHFSKLKGRGLILWTK
jgi:predicted nucleic acid-binding protein